MKKLKKKLKENKKIIIGLTGGLGSGKTTCAKVLRSLGAEVIDADRIAHEVTARGKSAYKRIVKAFGKTVLKKNRELNRAKLADLVFSRKNMLLKLNSVVHPEVIRRIEQRISVSRSAVLVLDAPLLIEAGLKRSVDHLVVVKAERRIQIRRLKRKLTRTEILNRIKAQMPLKSKVRMADFVIDNSGSLAKTKEQIRKIWRQITVCRNN
ncbi:dephospho-CoA kinase [Candidatus Omnitrophota bacterium]